MQADSGLHIYPALYTICDIFACDKELTSEIFSGLRNDKFNCCNISGELLYDIRNAVTYLSLLIVTYSGFSRRRAFTSSRSSRPSFCGFTGRFLYSEVYL